MPLDYDVDQVADDAEKYYGNRTKPVPKPDIEFGVDTENTLVYDLNAVDASRIDAARINAMTQVS